MHYEVPWLWDTSLNRKFIFSLSLLTPYPFLSRCFHIGEDIFQNSLKNNTCQVSFLRALMTEHVFISLISGLGLAGYKMLHSPALVLSLVSLYKSEALRAALTSSPSSYSILGWVLCVLPVCIMQTLDPATLSSFPKLHSHANLQKPFVP